MSNHIKPGLRHARILATLGIVTASLLWSLSPGAAGAQSRGKGAKKNPVVFYVVFQVGMDFEVVKKSEAKGRKKNIEDQYRAEFKAYNEAKKSARKAKESFTAPKPVKPLVKVYKKSFKSEAEARTYCDRLKAKQKKKNGPGKNGVGKAETFAVIEIDSSVKVVTKSELARLQKEVEEEYKKAVQAYNQARKNAVRKKQKFSDPSPKKRKVKVIGSSFKSEEKAITFMEKFLAKKKKGEEKLNKKKSKEKGK